MTKVFLSYFKLLNRSFSSVKGIPTCTIFIFLLMALSANARFQYVSPLPGSSNITVGHNIIIREGNMLDPLSLKKSIFSITGSKSGKHDFAVVLCNDGRTINLNPATAFAYDEDVVVSVEKGLLNTSGKALDDYTFSFKTHREYSAAEQLHFRNLHNILLEEELKENGVNHSLGETSDTRDVTGQFTIEVNNNPSPEKIFYDTRNGYWQESVFNSFQIIDTNGDSIYGGPNLLYYQDFKINKNGYLSVFNSAELREEVLDSSYHLIDKYYPANGYPINGHDFQLLPDGRAFMIADEYQVVDMTVYNPNFYPAANVVGSVIQEFDANHNLLFEWHSFDHIDIPEAIHENLAAGYIDYVHTNSLEIDNDGNIIASHRRLDQVTKIDINTGEFIWRMGGLKGNVTFINEPEPFTYQHDVRRIANGHLTMWDNGNFHNPQHSSAKEYVLNEASKTATLVWSYGPLSSDGTAAYFFAMGNMQRLPNGNTFINGGWETKVEYSNMWEINTSNQVVWELKLDDVQDIVSYRAVKFDWNPCARSTWNLMKAGNITSTSAKLHWSAATNAAKYKLQYRKSGELNWNEKMIAAPATSKLIANLQPNKKYEWRLQTWCSPNAISPFTSSRFFHTAPLKPGSLTREDELSFKIYPNPSHDFITIEISEGVSGLRILNLTGQLVKQMILDEVSPGKSIYISVGELPGGNYFLEITGEGKKEVGKLVVD